MPDETPLPPTSEPSHPLPAPPEVARPEVARPEEARPEEAGSDAVTPDDEDPGSLAAGKTVRSEQEQPGPGHEPELRETGGQEPAVTMAGVGHEVAEAGVGAEPDPAEPDPAEVPVVGAVPSGHTESEGAAAAPVPETTLVAGEAGEGGLDSGSPYAEGEPGSVGEYPTAVPEPGHIATSTPVEPEGRPCDEVVPGGPERDEDSLDEGHLGGGRQALADDEVTDDEIGRSVLAEEEFAAQLGPVHQAPAGGDDGVDDRFAEDEPPTEEPPTEEPPTDEPPTEERDGRAGGFDAASAGRSALDRGTGPASSFPRGLPDGGGGPAEPARGPEGPGGGVAMLTPRMRLLYAMRPRASRAQLLAMLLCFVLGLAGFLAVKQNQSLGLASMRQSDLVSLLDNVTEKSTRLEDETRRLQAVADRLRSGSDKSAAALQAAQQRLELLGILAGTSPAVGPGIELTITDPRGQVSAAILLDTVQELRDAGAEAIQIGDVRVVASTSFVDGDGTGGVRVDGKAVPRPYVFVVIGDSQTLSAALGIPGGVLEMLKQEGATGKAEPRPSVTVSALRTLSPPQHARPAMSAEP